MPPPPCRFFQIGSCRAGSSCRFSHDKSARVVGREACKFFAAGYCAHGDQCAFLHATRDGGNATQDTVSSSKKPICNVAAVSPRTDSIARKPMVISQMKGFSVERGMDDAASWMQPTEEEMAHSRGECCAVCLEPVVQSGLWFGLLDGCSHAFCLPCIRKWRETHVKRPEVARSCPVCRAPSHFVIPSSFSVSEARKPDLVIGYRQRLRAIPCRHFAFGEGQCPFGSSCFCKLMNY